MNFSFIIFRIKFQPMQSSSSSSDLNAKQLPAAVSSRVQKSRSFGNFQTTTATSSVSSGNRTLERVQHTSHQQSNKIMQPVDHENANMDDLVQNIIYAFTGVEGKYLKKDIIGGGLKLDPKVRLANVKHTAMLLRLAEIAFYHDQVESFTDPSSGKSPIGLLGQGLVTALKHELTLYYGMVAMLQEQLNRHQKANNNGIGDGIASGEKLTLRKIEIWIREPCIRLQWLANISEACQEKKGGALASEIFRFKHNGNTTIKAMVHDLLVAVCQPLQYMLSKWLLEGEINDPHSEFFIEVLPEVGTDRLWNDKYRVRESMLPSFISKYASLSS